MISNNSLASLRFILKTCSFCKMIPFEWNSVQMKLKPGSKRTIWIFRLHLVNVWAHTIFVCLSILRKKQENALQEALHALWILLFIAASIMGANIIIYRHELNGFVNKLHRFALTLRELCIL